MTNDSGKCHFRNRPQPGRFFFAFLLLAECCGRIGLQLDCLSPKDHNEPCRALRRQQLASISEWPQEGDVAASQQLAFRCLVNAVPGMGGAAVLARLRLSSDSRVLRD